MTDWPTPREDGTIPCPEQKCDGKIEANGSVWFNIKVFANHPPAVSVYGYGETALTCDANGHPFAHAELDRYVNEYAQCLNPTPIALQLEGLRAALRAENISYGELADLQGLAEHIGKDDVELLEWAGVPEFPDDPPSISFAGENPQDFLKHLPAGLAFKFPHFGQDDAQVTGEWVGCDDEGITFWTIMANPDDTPRLDSGGNIVRDDDDPTRLPWREVGPITIF